MKKVLKVIGIIIGFITAAAAIYLVVTKFMNKKQTIGNEEENYVSCSCCDEDFISETVV